MLQLLQSIFQTLLFSRWKIPDFDDIDDALIEGLSQNQDFFSLLLSNEEMKRQVLGIFADEIYKSLRNTN